jgi:hypothetical protein
MNVICPEVPDTAEVFPLFGIDQEIAGELICFRFQRPRIRVHVEPIHHDPPLMAVPQQVPGFVEK